MNNLDLDKEWFASWFESPYYDLLYTKRDEKEAAFFLDNLLTACPIQKGSKILDLPCGKGRHSIYLHKKGYNVTGADLSSRSIGFAKQFEKEGLHFFIHDMRNALPEGGFDLALNLFTSFGYFDSEEENIDVLRSIKNALNPDGHFVLDYLNEAKTRGSLVAEETKETKGAHFHIQRSIQQEFVVKKIKLTINGGIQHFIEKVRLYSLGQLEELFSRSGLKITKTAGDYHLNPYEKANSDRLILFATKR